MNNSNPLIILTGKTASGKDTVMEHLLRKFPAFKRIVTTTSRSMRPGEQNGKDYNFLSREDFENKIERGEFIEYVEYSGNLYGTEKVQITNNLNQGLIWRIDPSRAGKIKDFIKSAFDQNIADDLLKRVLSIYLTVDDTDILERLKRRNLGEEEITRRMQEDAKFWQEFKDNYDFVVNNVPGKLDETVQKVVDILQNRLS